MRGAAYLLGTVLASSGCVRAEISDAEGGIGGAMSGSSGVMSGGSDAVTAGNGGNMSRGGASSGGGSAGGTSTTGGSSQGGAAMGGSSGAAAAGGTGGMSDSVPPKLCAITLNCDGPIVDDPKIACRLSIVDGDGGSVYSDSAGVELRGRSSIKYPKPNYSLELQTASGSENPVNLLGMGKESDWVLDGSWVDRSFMRNMLTFSLFRDMGWYAARGRFCTLVLDGKEQGIYELREKIKRDDDRVALSDDDGTGKSLLLKQDDDGSLRLSIGAGARWQLIYPKEKSANDAQLAAAQSFLDQLDAALNGASANDATSGLPALLDIPQAVDFVLIEEFSKNVDAYNLSLFLARDAGQKARFIPWDFDLSYGQPAIRGVAANEQPSGWVNTRTRLITALTKVDALRTALAPRWRALRAGPLTNAAVLGKLERYQMTLDPAAIARNFSVWPLAEVDFSRIYGPYSLYPVSSYSDEVMQLRAWIEARLAFMDAHIDTYPN